MLTRDLARLRGVPERGVARRGSSRHAQILRYPARVRSSGRDTGRSACGSHPAGAPRCGRRSRPLGAIHGARRQLVSAARAEGFRPAPPRPRVPMRASISAGPAPIEPPPGKSDSRAVASVPATRCWSTWGLEQSGQVGPGRAPAGGDDHLRRNDPARGSATPPRTSRAGPLSIQVMPS